MGLGKKEISMWLVWGKYLQIKRLVSWTMTFELTDAEKKGFFSFLVEERDVVNAYFGMITSRCSGRKAGLEGAAEIEPNANLKL